MSIHLKIPTTTFKNVHTHSPSNHALSSLSKGNNGGRVRKLNGEGLLYSVICSGKKNKNKNEAIS